MKFISFGSFLRGSWLSIALFICLASLVRCSKFDAPATYTPLPTDTVTYTESDTDFANPERGFYRYTVTDAGSYTPLDNAQLMAWRTLQQADGGGAYKIYSTLVFRYFILSGLTNSPLPSGLLDKIKADFVLARQAGVKLIPRFAYTQTANPGACPEGFICPLYGDAPKDIVLQHIAQLKPLLQENADVIACMQLGFVGVWGENYYTDYFGDASSNGQGQLYDNNWQDRIDVLKALLDALPADRMVQVRYPQLKQRLVYGTDALPSSAALTDAEAFSGTFKARIGLHNDCFLSGVGDYGTYDDYGNSATPRQSAITLLTAYAQADNKYTAVGGETCDDTYSPQNDCENAGMAQTVMNGLHYSFLNCAYNNDVNNDWVDGGCMDNIKKNLGYRFVLKSGVYPGAPVKAGMQFAFTLFLKNEGYASPFNERPAKLIMRHQVSGKEFVFPLTADVRRWYSGELQVDERVLTDATMPQGKYNLFLYLPDKYPSIAARPEYAIRLANAGVWETATGYNQLSATITIDQ
ncbi:MAG TPA: DUF4832 domain-containing protein [Puia sp.]|nr:DUF4832 domain-containing protein [Puia sp.]